MCYKWKETLSSQIAFHVVFMTATEILAKTSVPFFVTVLKPCAHWELGMPPILQRACGPSNSVQHSLFPVSYSVQDRVVWVPCSVGQIVISVLWFR